MPLRLDKPTLILEESVLTREKMELRMKHFGLSVALLICLSLILPNTADAKKRTNRKSISNIKTFLSAPKKKRVAFIRTLQRAYNDIHLMQEQSRVIPDKRRRKRSSWLDLVISEAYASSGFCSIAGWKTPRHSSGACYSTQQQKEEWTRNCNGPQAKKVGEGIGSQYYMCQPWLYRASGGKFLCVKRTPMCKEDSYWPNKKL
jgi:hypothetical protein